MIRDKGKRKREESKLTELVERIGEFIKAHAKIIIISVVSVIIVGVALGWFFYHRHQVKLEASLEYSDFVDEYMKPRKAPEGSEGVELRDISAMEKKYSLLDGKYNGTVYPAMALYFLGVAYFEEGEYKKALESFEECHHRSDKELLTIVSLWGQADCYRAMGKLEEAVKIYNQTCEEHTGHPLIPGMLMQMAKCYVKMDETEKAVDTYSQIAIEYPQSAFVEDAKELITYLGG